MLNIANESMGSRSIAIVRCVNIIVFISIISLIQTIDDAQKPDTY